MAEEEDEEDVEEDGESRGKSGNEEDEYFDEEGEEEEEGALGHGSANVLRLKSSSGESRLSLNRSHRQDRIEERKEAKKESHHHHHHQSASRFGSSTLRHSQIPAVSGRFCFVFCFVLFFVFLHFPKFLSAF